MTKKIISFHLLFLLTMFVSAQNQLLETIPEINYEKFQLDNGLTVVVHQDKKVPMVAVNVWYHVGSKNEKVGKTGFAHLFEHLMFNGTENYNSEYFEPFEQVGATDQNGTTNSDRTNYFQNVPTNALDLALWMESDRMGHILDVIDQEKLDEQRGVVQNEKRQGENRPYGKAFLKISNGAYPKGHPYSWSTIGSMEDLDAATLDDVKEWFKTYYGPNNAVVVLAGDIDLKTAKEKMNLYFGDIPAGPPLSKPMKWIGKRTEEKREVLYDNVPQTAIYKVWNTPGYDSDDEVLLSLAANVFSDQKNSPLYRELVYEKQISTGVSASYIGREISGLFYIVAEVAPNSDPKEVEEALDAALANYIEEGPNQDLLEAEKTKTYASFIRGLQRIGGFGGKSDILASCEVYYKNPGCYKDYLENLLSVNKDDIKTSLSKWIDDTPYVLTISPEKKYSVSETNLKRDDGIPYPTEKVSYQFPEIKTSTLKNGSKIVLSQRSNLPIVQIQILFNRGYAEENNRTLGHTNFMMDMLNEGTKNYNALEFDSEVNKIGSSIGYGSSLDSSVINISSLKPNLDRTLDLVKETMLYPTFDKNEIERIKKLSLASIEQELNQPRALAYRKIGELLYGAKHPYGKPLTGSGTLESIRSIKKNNLEEKFKSVINSNHSTFIVVGDINMQEAKNLLNKKFGDWKSKKPNKSKTLFTANLPKSRTIYLVDKPNAIQSFIVSGQLIPPSATSDEIEIAYMNYAIGGSFTSRLNMNLREDKGWSYGVRNRLSDNLGQRLFLVNAPVQTDKTADSIKEIINEYENYLGKNPITTEELTKAKNSRILRLPGQYETIGALLGGISNIVKYERDYDYLNKLSESLDKPTLEKIRETAIKYIRPDQWTWLIVGDVKEIQEKIEALDIGEVIVLD